MDDSVPLLNDSAPADLEADVSALEASSMEELIEPYVTDLTSRLALQTMVTTMAAIFVGQQTFISIFTDANQTWHCNTQVGAEICNPGSNICKLPSNSWTWDKPSYTSIVSEWFLQCAGSSIITGLPASSFFIGNLFAGLVLFFVGDSYGRKQSLLSSSVIMSTASLLAAFSNNVWIYSALKFLIGYGCGQIGSCALVLATEGVGKQWQGRVATVRFLFFTGGFATLPAIAYVCRNESWRILYLLTSVPAILYCLLLQFCAYESPRWLLAQGHHQEALLILKKLSGTDIRNSCDNLHIPPTEANQGQDLVLIRNKKTFTDLFTTPGLLKRLILTMIIAFGAGTMYYGLPLALGNLESNNAYVSVAFNALLEVPSELLALLVASTLKRRNMLLALCIISGASGIILCFMNEWKLIQLGLELVSFFTASMLLTLLVIYATELFPTKVRNTAVSMVFQAAAVAGAFAPVLIAAAGVGYEVAPYGVFGALVTITGSVVIFLPETFMVAAAKDEIHA